MRPVLLELLAVVDETRLGGPAPSIEQRFGREHAYFFALDLLAWLRAAHRHPWRRLRVSGPFGAIVSRMIAETPDLSELFEVLRGQVKFRMTIPLGEQRAICSFVHERWAPPFDYTK